MTRITIALLAATTLVGGAMAAEQNGASARSPGHEMQEQGSRKGSPGASGYALGHGAVPRRDLSRSAGSSHACHGPLL